MKKRLISLLLFVAMVLSLLPVGTIFTVAAGTPTVSVASVSALPGATVQIPVTITGNPGILGAKLTFTYDAGLTLTAAKAGDAFSALTLTKPGQFTSPCSFTWDGQELEDSDIKDGTILTLTFAVGDTVEAGTELAVTASYAARGIVDQNLQPVTVNIENGAVTVINYKPGDLDSDGEVNPTDTILLRRHIAGGYEQTINELAGDVNADGTLDVSDVILIRRFLAGGYGVELLPGLINAEHTHTLVAVAAKAATCTTEGNDAHWECSACHKLFSDKDGLNEILLTDVTTPKIAHNYINGICEYCGARKPATNYDYTITYEPAGVVIGIDGESSGSGKNYLENEIAAGTVVNANDPGYYTASGYALKNLRCKGFTFQGWYDAAGNHISEIPSGAKRDYELYAHWKADKYTLTYKTYQNLPMPTSKGDQTTVTESFAVYEGVPELWTPDVKDYVFLGWYRNDDTEATEIPVGTTENVTLKGYCTSRRNLAVSKKDTNPIILEDHDNNVVYFTYEIGEIRNIPLNADRPFWSIESVAGLSQQVSETYTTTITAEEAKSVAETVSKMTVDSSTWALSENWNDITTVDESWAESVGKTSEQCKTEATSSSGTLSISDQMGGSSYHKSEDGSTVYDYDSKTVTKDKGHQFDVNVNASYANKLETSLGTASEYGAADSYGYTEKAKLTGENGSYQGSQSGSTSAQNKDAYSTGLKSENGFEVNGSLSYGYQNKTNTVTKTGTDKVTVNSNIDENTSTWNNSASFSTTQQHSSNQTVRNTLSDVVTTTKNYGSSYSHGGSNTSTQGFSSSASNTAGTTSSVTYSKLESHTRTTTYSVDGHIEGRYRCILVGTAHVFGVVGYDYNTKSYFTYTFSVMDDKTEEFLDYTPKGGNFTDCENSCLPFEIPIDVYNYVNEKTAKTNGIQYTTNSQNGTAKVFNYVGTDLDVVVPSYVSDGNQAYRVTEITSTAFAGKPVRAVVLGEFIKTIPDGAFMNCTNLEGVVGSFTEIGDHAFAGCANLSNMNIPSNVSRIGTDAFANAGSIKVRAINSLCAYAKAFETLGYNDPKTLISSDDAKIEAKQKEITQTFIQSVLNSGAKNISIDLSYIIEGAALNLAVPAIDSVTISGGGRTYESFSLNSSATETALNELTIVNQQSTPLTIFSDKLTLCKVFVTSNSTALDLQKDGAILSLIQDSVMQSASYFAVKSKSLMIESQITANGSAGLLNVTHNFGYENSIQGQNHVIFTDGEFIEIGSNVQVALDAAGGTLSTNSITARVGSPIGTLPTPTRDYYTFNGWYTAGGDLVTADTVFTMGGNETLYAHWTQNPPCWELASSVPSGAQIVATKWEYKQRETTTSSSSSMSGWTKYDTKRTSWGATQGPVYNDPSNGARNVWSEQYVTSSNYKTIYVYYRYTETAEDTGNTWSNNTGHRQEYRFDYPLTLKIDDNWYGHQTYKYYYTAATGNTLSGKYKVVCYGGTEQQWVSDNYGTRWYYQEPVYTYYFERYVSKTTTASDPTGQSGVSNVVKWVQYRAK